MRFLFHSQHTFVLFSQASTHTHTHRAHTHTQAAHTHTQTYSLSRSQTGFNVYSKYINRCPC